jgi:hypothetical protein
MNSKQNQITKKQHFVPQFYLKRFANGENFVNVLDLQNRRMAKPRPYASVCYDKFFYAVRTGKEDEISQQIEDYFQDLENKLAPIYSDFIDHVVEYKQIDDEEIYYVAYFMSLLWIRSAFFRKNMNRMSSDMMKQSNKFRASHPGFNDHIRSLYEKNGKTISDEDIKLYQKTLLDGNYTLEFSNREHLMFLKEIDPFANMFYGKNWRAYIASGDSEFITSDTPITEVVPKRTDYWGTTFLERQHYLALTPKVIIELVDPRSGKKFKRKQVDDDEVLRFNFLRASLSLEFCYSREENVLQEMLAIAEANNPFK